MSNLADKARWCEMMDDEGSDTCEKSLWMNGKRMTKFKDKEGKHLGSAFSRLKKVPEMEN